jgi:16S rRNA (guanine527-N7)-methyltransferase
MAPRQATRKTDPDLALDRARAHALFARDVSRETWKRLDDLVALLLKWQRTTNLIAPSTLAEVWTRHVADSLQLLTIAPDARAWVDLGSGGGFPGLVLACAMADHPGAKIELVESNQKKSAFLREAARVLGVPAIVHARRIEDFVSAPVQSFDVVTARALAPLDKLLGYASPLLKTGAIGLFPKGQDVEAELTAASKSWIMDAELVPSVTDPQARIVVVRRAAKLTPCN